MDVTLPDGTLVQGIPDGTTKSQIASKMKAAGHAVPDEWLAPSATKAAQPFSAGETADVAASLATGAGASILGGISKAGGYLKQAAGYGAPGENVAAEGDKLAEGLTWAPKTERGKAVMADIGKGLQAFEDWTDKMGDKERAAMLAAGDKLGDVAKRLGAPKSVVDFIDEHKAAASGFVGAAMKTGLNAFPMALGGEALKMRGRAPEAPLPAETPPGSPSVAPAAASSAPLTLEADQPRAAPAPPAPPTAAPATAPLETAPAVPRGTPNTSLEGSTPPSPQVSPQARAQAYVRDRLGLAWAALADRRKQKLTAVAKDAGALERLNPDAVKRQAHLEREGAGRVPIATTAGKLERDNAQLLREQGAAATPSGRSIVETDVKANRDLRRNIETLVERWRGVGTSRATATSREQVGKAVAGREEGAPGALTLKQRKAKAATSAAYKSARETEPNATVPADPMYDMVRGNPEILNPQVQHVAWLQSWLKRAGIEKVEEVAGEGGETEVKTVRRPVKLKELEDLRQKAVKMAGSPGADGYYAGEVIKTIDQMYEAIPDSAKAWKAAREAHKTERAEFANQGAIERLVGTKGGRFGTDPKTDLENVWKEAYKNASLEEVRQLKRSLLSGDAETRVAGKKALRELRAETGRDMLREITKGVSTNTAGETNITAEAINTWIKGMGGGTVEGGIEKLNVLVGKRAANELMKIREDAQITKTEPTVRNVGSNTFQKILNWMDDTGLGKLTKAVGGGPLLHAAEFVHKHHEAGKAVKSATESATSVAERRAAGAIDKRLRTLQQQQGGVPPTYQANP